MKHRALAWAGLVIIGASIATRLTAQMALWYVTSKETVNIVAVQQERQMYVKDGKLQPAPPNGTWRLEPAESYAEATGEVAVRYSQKYFPAAAPLRPDDLVQVLVEVTFHSDHPARGLYLYCFWEVEGRIVATDLRLFPDVDVGGNSWPWRADFMIKAAERHGTLHAYLMQNGRSLSGLSQTNQVLAPLRALIDAGAAGAAGEWLRGPGRGRELPQSMIEQIAQLGDAGLLELALGGVNVTHAKGKDGRNLLIAATQAARESCVELLLKMKIDADSQDKHGYPAMYDALRGNEPGVVKKLLAAGASATRLSRDEFDPPLALAFRYSDLSIINLLLEHGAKWPDRKTRGESFSQAVADGRADVAKMFLDRETDPNQLYEGSPVLMIAAMRADQAMLKILLGAGAKTEATNGDAETPIMGAAFVGSAEAVEMLGQAGASLAKTGSLNRTAAGFAVVGGHPDLGLKLFNQVLLTGPAASRLLHDALVANADDLVAALLAQKVELDPTAPDIEDVIDRAICGGDLGLVASALDRGFKMDRKVFGDWSLASLAKRYGQVEISAELARRVELELWTLEPPTANWPTQIIKRGPGISSDDMGADLKDGGAVVDIFVDAQGVPRVPVLVGASNPRLGRAAIRDTLKSRYNPLPGDTKAWRHTVVSYARKLEGDIVFESWEVTRRPMRKEMRSPELKAGGDPHLPQVAVMRFVVTAEGDVSSPSVLAISSPEMESEAIERVKTWKYDPATRNGKPVRCAHVARVLLPDGSTPGFDNFYPLATPATAGMPPPKTKKHGSLEWGPLGHIPLPNRGIAVIRFVVNRLGYATNVRVLGSSDAALAKRASKMCEDFEFEPTLVEGVPIERPMVWICATGIWE